MVNYEFTLGRFNSAKWGPEIDGKLGWVVFESVPLITFCITLYKNLNVLEHEQILLSVMFIVHYIHRAFIYPWFNPKMSPTNLATVSTAIFFNVMNGYIQGYSVAFNKEDQVIHAFTGQKIIGGLFFIAGMTINTMSDYSMFAQRRVVLSKKKKSTYIIPRGFLYEYVSCPNLLGEIIEWAGWCLAVNSLAGVAFFVFTFSNLFPKAINGHKWLKDKFPEYPSNRKILIPFIF